jgi:PAS domain S-box-containing protein
VTGPLLLCSSIALQLAAAVLALRLTRVTGRCGPWYAIAAALFLMGLRRGVTLADLLRGGDLARLDAAAEWIALAISALMVFGVSRLSPLLTDMTTALARREESEARWRAYIDRAPLGILVADAAGRYLDANAEAARITGYDPAELRGVNLRDLVPPESADAAEAHFRRAVEAGHAEGEMWKLRKDGEPFWAFTSAVRLGEDRFLGFLRDETVRKRDRIAAIRREAELARAKAEWERTFDAVPDLICLLDANFTILRANRAMVERLGGDADRVVGAHCHECFHQSDAPPDFCPHVRTLADGAEHVAEVYEPRLGGHFLVTTTPVRDDNGQPVGSVHVARDITRRKAMEDALRESERKYRTIAENTSDGLFVYEGGRITYTSPAYDRMMGYEPGEIVGWTDEDIFEVLHPEDREPIARRIETARKNREERLAYRFRARNGNGPYIWREDHAGLQYDEAGEMVRAYVVARDVTEQVRTEAALREHREALNRQLDFSWRILNSTDAHMAVVGPDGRILEVNEAWRRFARENDGGPEKNWGEGANYFDACAPDGGEGDLCAAVRDGIRDVQSGRIPRFEMEYPCHGPAASRWFVLRALPLTGRPGTALVSHTDVTPRVRAEREREAALTERMALERQVRQAQKLESLGVLASGIAHDFNNLLLAIMGNADLAAADLPADSPALESVGEIERAARRAAELCRQMLAYSGRGRFVVEVMDLNALVREMTELLKVSISKKACLELQLTPEETPIQGDPTQIRQVVMNLVVNASDALGAGTGRIRVASRVVVMTDDALKEGLPMGPLPGGRYVEIEVADTGCGMEAETLDRLFEPFFTTKSSGRGLGMASVLGIVHGHGGKLRLESAPGNGTTFRIYLPAAETLRPRAEVERTPSPWRGEGTVLVVDDEPELRELAMKMLERIGFRVLTAADGREALRRYETASEIDLVLLDLTMPEMDGVETFHALVKQYPAVRVIVSSGYSAHEIAGRFAGDNFLGVIEKPYTLATLERRLAAVFQGEG